MKNLLTRFEEKAPEIVFEWHDTETSARGWTVINSLRGALPAVEHGCGAAWTAGKWSPWPRPWK